MVITPPEKDKMEKLVESKLDLERPSITELIKLKTIKEINIRLENNDLEVTYQKIIETLKKQNKIIKNDLEGKDYQ